LLIGYKKMFMGKEHNAGQIEMIRNRAVAKINLPSFHIWSKEDATFYVPEFTEIFGDDLFIRHNLCKDILQAIESEMHNLNLPIRYYCYFLK